MSRFMYSLRCQIHASLTRHLKYALFWPLCANVVLFIKPEIHNISQRLGLHRKTGPRPCLTCTKYLVKLGRVVLEICSRTGTQIHDTHHNTLLPYQGRSRVVHGSILCDQIQPNPSADWPNLTQPKPLQVETRSSAIAEGPRDASCQLKSCQLPRNSAWTTCTSPEQIEVMSSRVTVGRCVINMCTQPWRDRVAFIVLLVS